MVILEILVVILAFIVIALAISSRKLRAIIYRKNNNISAFSTCKGTGMTRRFVLPDIPIMHTNINDRSRLSTIKITVSLLPGNTKEVCSNALSELQGKDIRWYFIQGSSLGTNASNIAKNMTIYAVHDVRTVIDRSAAEVLFLLMSEISKILTKHGVNYKTVSALPK